MARRGAARGGHVTVAAHRPPHAHVHGATASHRQPPPSEAPLTRTSLPPGVVGDVRFTLRVAVPKIVWLESGREGTPVQVRLKWWGEDGEGTVFRPREPSFDVARDASAAVFEVRCQRKTLEAYLRDMGALVMDVARSDTGDSLGKARIGNVAFIARGQPFSGSFSVSNAEGLKVAYLMVEMALLTPDSRPLSSSGRGEGAEHGTSGALDNSSGSGGDAVRRKPLVLREVDVEKRLAELRGEGRGASAGESSSHGASPRSIHARASDVVIVGQENQTERRGGVEVSEGRRVADGQHHTRAHASGDAGVDDGVRRPVGDANEGAVDEGDEDVLSALIGRGRRLQREIAASAGEDEGSLGDAHTHGGESGGRGRSDRGAAHPRNTLADIAGIDSDASGEGSSSGLEDDILEELFYSVPAHGRRPAGRAHSGSSDSGSDEEAVPAPAAKQPKAATTQRPIAGDAPPPRKVSSLGVGTLTELGRVYAARLHVDRLVLGTGAQEGDADARRTYFLEYQFPVAVAGAGEVKAERMRAASAKVDGKVVTLTHRGVFPVVFDADVIDHWWSKSVPFKILVRAARDKAATVLGTATLPLRSVLTAPGFTLSTSLHMTPVANARLANAGARQKTTPSLLQVRLSLAVDGRTGARASSPLPPLQQPAAALGLPDSVVRATVTATEDEPQPQSALETASGSAQAGHVPVRQPVHLLVEVGSIRGVSPPRNLYAVCRVLSLDESRTDVHWGERCPDFGLSLSIPVMLTPAVANGFRGNSVVVEVWDKTHGDELVGLVRLPLHPAYLALRDAEVAAAMLSASSAVEAAPVGEYPVVNPFTGSEEGRLVAMVAVGTAAQLAPLRGSAALRSRALAMQTIAVGTDAAHRDAASSPLPRPKDRDARRSVRAASVSPSRPASDSSPRDSPRKRRTHKPHRDHSPSSRDARRPHQRSASNSPGPSHRRRRDDARHRSLSASPSSADRGEERKEKGRWWNEKRMRARSSSRSRSRSPSHVDGERARWRRGGDYGSQRTKTERRRVDRSESPDWRRLCEDLLQKRATGDALRREYEAVRAARDGDRGARAADLDARDLLHTSSPHRSSYAWDDDAPSRLRSSGGPFDRDPPLSEARTEVLEGHIHAHPRAEEHAREAAPRSDSPDWRALAAEMAGTAPTLSSSRATGAGSAAVATSTTDLDMAVAAKRIAHADGPEALGEVGDEGKGGHALDDDARAADALPAEGEGAAPLDEPRSYTEESAGGESGGSGDEEYADDFEEYASAEPSTVGEEISERISADESASRGTAEPHAHSQSVHRDVARGSLGDSLRTTWSDARPPTAPRASSRASTAARTTDASEWLPGASTDSRRVAGPAAAPRSATSAPHREQPASPSSVRSGRSSQADVPSPRRDKQPERPVPSGGSVEEREDLRMGARGERDAARHKDGDNARTTSTHTEREGTGVPPRGYRPAARDVPGRHAHADASSYTRVPFSTERPEDCHRPMDHYRSAVPRQPARPGSLASDPFVAAAIVPPTRPLPAPRLAPWPDRPRVPLPIGADPELERIRRVFAMAGGRS